MFIVSAKNSRSSERQSNRLSFQYRSTNKNEGVPCMRHLLARSGISKCPPVEVNQIAQLGGFTQGYENMRQPPIRVHKKGKLRVDICQRISDGKSGDE